jgi:type I restriction enzyme, S subunit
MLSEVPQGWDELLFGELTSIVGGTTPKKNIEEYWDSEDVLWATPTDITSLPEASHFLSDTATKASIRAVERGGLKLLPANTVLMTSRATIGYVAIAKSEISTNQGFANFLPSEKYVPLFLLYLLQSKKEQLISSAGGSTFKEISKGILKSLSTLLPPLNEQHRIAEILSSVDESIQATQAVIKQAERVKRGLMEELLTGGLGSEAIERGEVPEGWIQAKFIDFVTLKRGYDLPVGQRIEGDVPVVASNGQVGWHNEPKVEAPVIVTGRSGTIGKVELYEMDCHPLNTTLYSTDLHGNNPYFAKYFIQHFKVERYATGTGVPTLNRNLVHEVVIVIPPLNEQGRIAKILSGFDESIASYKANIEHQSRVKKGLMNDLLTGKVRTV